MTHLTTALEKRKNRIGLVGTRLKFERPKTGRGLTEYITHDWKEIVVRVREDLNLTPDRETKIYLEKVLQDYELETEDKPLEITAVDLLNHGCGHRELPTETTRGCPYTVEYHDQIKDGIAQGLKEKGKTGLESYVTNAFEDVIDNVNTRTQTRHAGQVIFWNNEGLEQGFSQFYEAFVKINLALWGRAIDASLLKRFYSNDPSVQEAVNKFKNYLKNQLKTNSLVRLDEKPTLVDKLFNKSEWRDLGYQFAIATADLLEDSQPSQRVCFGNEGENPFDKELRLPKTQEELAHTRYKTGRGASHHEDPLLQLDALYRKLSREVIVRTKSYQEASSLPIAYYGRRNPTEDTVKVQRIKGIGITEEGDVTLKVARHSLQYPVTYKTHPREFPRLKVVVLDTSGSMAQSPENNDEVGNTSFIPWGDRSKYHYALKGLYGIDNYLERQGIAAYVSAEAIVFADQTRTTGRQKLRSEEERRALLKKPTSKTTSLDPSIVKAAVGERSFLVSISDGEIENWSTVKETYREAIASQDYCHIHIGPKNTFTADLESWGVKVEYVRGDDDLSKLLIDTTAHYYKQVA